MKWVTEDDDGRIREATQEEIDATIQEWESYTDNSETEQSDN